MKISLNWIKEYIPGLGFETEDSLEKLKEMMIATGLDIEGIQNEGDIYNNFVVGEVTEKQKHPNADKLSLCKVNTGSNISSIVCGAPNVEAGQKVCVAVIGAIIPNGNFEITKSKIRGELSEGMICSAKELNINDNHDGILVLDKDAKVGESFSKYMKANDILFEIGITPNRGDLFSHFGIAREIAALFGRKIEIPLIKINETQELTTSQIKISILNKEFCKRFIGRVIKNVTIKDSPGWLQNRIKSIGLRPRNNIVDITNFVMFETGQPLHAFDYDKIRGKEIIVKNANEGDKFTTLDSKERILNSESLMVCDAEGYSGIAGIMGGETSEITNDTKNIFLESAYFDPVAVRKNSKKLVLQTDASQRFERGIDINMVEYASRRATQLIQEICGGEVSKELYDLYENEFEKLIVGVRAAKSNALLGIALTEDEIINLLSKIEIKFLKKENEFLEFEIPEFRRLDIQKEVDLIEEIARIYGYDNIEGITNFNINVANSSKENKNSEKVIEIITNHFIGRGFNQILTETLLDEKKINFFGGNPVKLKNSITSEVNSLRTNLTYGMMEVIKTNFNNSGKKISLKLFETGKVFADDIPETKKFREENHLIFALSGKRDRELIYGGDENFDIFDIKGEAEMFLSKLNLENYGLFYYNDEKLNGIKIEVRLKDELIGIIYKADSELKKEFDFDKDTEVYFAEFNIELITKNVNFSRIYNPISKFPSIKRDLAITVDKKVKYEEIKDSVLRSGGRLLKEMELFDIYEGDKIEQSRKSLAFSLEFASSERTLNDEETKVIIDKIIKNLTKNLGAELRK